MGKAHDLGGICTLRGGAFPLFSGWSNLPFVDSDEIVGSLKAEAFVIDERTCFDRGSLNRIGLSSHRWRYIVSIGRLKL
ncbi:MAG: hypothetical protein WCR76_05090 [Sphaerochaetaceae bacterium]|jgi:hypothetical protein